MIFKSSILVEDERAATGESYLLIVGHVLWLPDLQRSGELRSLQVEDLHVLGNSFPERKAVWSDA